MRQLLPPWNSILIFLFLLPSALFAQKVSSLKAVAMQDSVKISYELEDTLSSRVFAVSLYAIREGDTVQLKELSGDVGQNIGPGKHQVIWQAYREWNRFRGQVRFYVKALPSFSFLTPTDSMSIRRARTMLFSWYGANSTVDTLRVELYSYEKRIDTIGHLNRTGEFAWRVPPKLPKGDGYRIKVIGLEASPIQEFSPYFSVLPRYPLWQKIALAGLGVGGVITYFALRVLPPPDPGLIRRP